MNVLGEKQISVHAQVVGWLFIASHVILLVVAVLLFFLLTGIGIVTQDSEAMKILGGTALWVGLLLTIIAM